MKVYFIFNLFNLQGSNLHYQSIMLYILMTKILKSKMGYFIDVGQCGKYIHYGTFSYHKYKLLKICPYN